MLNMEDQITKTGTIEQSKQIPQIKDQPDPTIRETRSKTQIEEKTVVE